MPYPCFLAEAVNVRSTLRFCDDDEDCAGWEDHVFDVARVDTGEIIATDLEHWYVKALPVGTMRWAEVTEKNQPIGPDDWDGIDASYREMGQEAPDHTGQVRHPSYLFVSGLQLQVLTPGGWWTITSRGSNCTMPYDYQHRCWVIQGEPPNITVDKNGLTCQAGAGSIQCGGYHGFLQNGALTDG